MECGWKSDTLCITWHAYIMLHRLINTSFDTIHLQTKLLHPFGSFNSYINLWSLKTKWYISFLVHNVYQVSLSISCKHPIRSLSLQVFECLIDFLQIKMSLQLYQVDQKSYLLDFKSLNTQDHPDAARVKRMTRASMSASGTDPGNFIFSRHS